MTRRDPNFYYDGRCEARTAKGEQCSREVAKTGDTLCRQHGTRTNPPRTVSGWFRAWERAMGEQGYPNARMTLDYDPDSGLSYSWNSDIDELAEATVEERRPIPDDNAWAVAHDCFIAVDHLRPVYIPRSPALIEMMDGP